MNEKLNDKIQDIFSDMVVYKDLQKTSIFSSLKLPSFLRDWLLKTFAEGDGNIDVNKINHFVKTYIPPRTEWTRIKNDLVNEIDKVKLFTKINVDVDVRKSEITFALPEYGLDHRDTIIEPYIWDDCKENLMTGSETWGMIELGYRPPQESPRRDGKVTLEKFKNFCPYTIDIEYYKDARAEFQIDEWIDILLSAVDYNPEGYVGDTAVEQKLSMLTRIIPFAEKRLNLVELAPKGTGKSYIYGGLSRYGWLSSGGTMTRAKMFYDMQKGTEGLISGNDYVVLDEVQTIRFSDNDEMRAALKGYLENGKFTVGKYEGKSDASFILSGNIEMDTMNEDGYGNMFVELPELFHESALIDRFHGFIKGWNIPRMTDSLKVCGWGLNSEYFTTILHELRNEIEYRAVVDELLVVPKGSDTRDTEAVKRITTAYLKLLFPHVRKPDDITAREFKKYCCNRARSMRSIIKFQLGILDPSEFRGKDVPMFGINDKLCKEEKY